MTLTEPDRQTESPRPAAKPAPAKAPKHPPLNRAAIWVPLIVVLLLGVGLVFGIWRHIQQVREQREFAAKTQQVIVEFQPVAYDPKPRGGLDSLYTSSVLAIRPKTGEIACYYQYTPNDVYDVDGTDENVLADIQVNGQPREYCTPMKR